MATKGMGKPKWTRGKEMPLFSKKSWSELEDIWPREIRLSSEACLIAGLFAPAWLKTLAFMDTAIGKRIVMREFFLLCWLHRVEEAREGVAFHAWPAMKGLNIGGKLWYIRKAGLTKCGLIENLPVKDHTYRITELGKLVVKKFIDNLQETRDELGANMLKEGEFVETRRRKDQLPELIKSLESDEP